ncbi:hypothetical protein Vretifemale_13687, partial [Volvox reticuliferus]
GGSNTTAASNELTQTASGTMEPERSSSAYGGAVLHVAVNSTDETVTVVDTAVATAAVMATAAVSPSCSSCSPTEGSNSTKMLQPVLFHSRVPQLQPLQPPQESPPQQQSPPPLHHQPHPPPHPYSHSLPGHSGGRWRGFGGSVTAEDAIGSGGGDGGAASSSSSCGNGGDNGGGSAIFTTTNMGGFGGGKVPRADSPFAVCMDEVCKVGSAV